eukprot:GHVU01141364.1.p1 GENE.GHVU01141364.1~~GHVU01141364.1.p1  ORF type:complete len:502 (+),score=60.51 GHVU01141364.1:290-1795(+)
MLRSNMKYGWKLGFLQQLRAVPRICQVARVATFPAPPNKHFFTTGSAAVARAPEQKTHGNGAKQSRRSASDLKPLDIVAYLDRHIIGQTAAKRAVANALRNRWRRRQLKDEDLKEDVIPKNILMVGPTGVGKTEIARRLARMVDAPFIKVEATKFTEVGFHGRDVESIISDLVETAKKDQQKKLEQEYREQARVLADTAVLEALFGTTSKQERDAWLQHLHSGHLDDRIVNVELPYGDSLMGDSLGSKNNRKGGINIASGPSEIRKERRTMTVRDARDRLILQHLEILITPEMILARAIESVEQEGIVFLDEIDKICSKDDQGYKGSDASDEGVQRDLLPLIEGTTAATKYGNVRTDFILFIASGAFHGVKPGDMLAELRGRLPVRVELASLDENDFLRILTETRHNLIMQNEALMATEGVQITFTEDGIREMARLAVQTNTEIEDIGARRLYALMEKLMDDISFEAPQMEDGTEVVIDSERVREALKDTVKKIDLHKFIL